MDVHSKEVRSYNMSRIRGKNSSLEIILRKILFSRGFRYRINVKSLPGTPDIVLKKYKTVIFVDGCFWHCCPTCYREPENNKEFWQKKIATNVARDKEVNKLLTEAGWTVLRFWEHEVKKDIDRVIDVIKANLSEKVVYSKYNIVNKADISLVAEDEEKYLGKR